jgi:hypothetical protein
MNLEEITVRAHDLPGGGVPLAEVRQMVART